MYFPGSRANWERRTPEEAGMDSSKLKEAIDFANGHETDDPKDLLLRFRLSHGSKRYDDGKLLGFLKSPRGDVNGIVLRNGYIVTEWGDTKRVDLTYSVTKSYLSTTAGLALDRGLIEDVHDRVRDYVKDGSFDSPHNAKITWHNLLQQTSEWEGTLWDKHVSAGSPNDELREQREPGTFYEYNDVKVNLLGLSLLHVWRTPLPKVLKDEIMDPINASNTWRWYGYHNSWVTIDGVKMQSVSGGGHWGGGMYASTRDHARFGYLFLRRGKWGEQQLISEKWVDMATTPCDVNPVYGYMWWLNTDKKNLPSAPDNCFSARGAGGNRILIVPDHEIVIVVRWVAPKHFDGFVERVLEAIR